MLEPHQPGSPVPHLTEVQLKNKLYYHFRDPGRGTTCRPPAQSTHTHAPPALANRRSLHTWCSTLSSVGPVHGRECTEPKRMKCRSISDNCGYREQPDFMCYRYAERPQFTCNELNNEMIPMRFQDRETGTKPSPVSFPTT